MLVGFVKKRTHLIFAALLFLALSGFFSFPVLFVVFAIIGAVLPDFDLWLGGLHRKLLHNVWALLVIIFVGFHFSLLDKAIAIALSIGFLSHLLADSLTPAGIKPFWPFPIPHFKGPIKTGGFFEFILTIILLAVIGYLLGIVQIRFVF